MDYNLPKNEWILTLKFVILIEVRFNLLFINPKFNKKL